MITTNKHNKEVRLIVNTNRTKRNETRRNGMKRNKDLTDLTQTQPLVYHD